MCRLTATRNRKSLDPVINAIKRTVQQEFVETVLSRRDNRTKPRALTHISAKIRKRPVQAQGWWGEAPERPKRSSKAPEVVPLY
jgi:hypothetical protein